MKDNYLWHFWTLNKLVKIWITTHDWILDLIMEIVWTPLFDHYNQFYSYTTSVCFMLLSFTSAEETSICKRSFLTKVSSNKICYWRLKFLWKFYWPKLRTEEYHAMWQPASHFLLSVSLVTPGQATNSRQLSMMVGPFCLCDGQQTWKEGWGSQNDFKLLHHLN